MESVELAKQVKQTSDNNVLNEFCGYAMSCDFTQLERFFHLPVIIVNNDDRHVFNDHSKLQSWLSIYCQNIELMNAEQVNLNITKSLQLSDNVRFSQVVLNDIRIKETRATLNVSFTLAQDETHDSVKIIVAVLDDA